MKVHKFKVILVVFWSLVALAALSAGVILVSQIREVFRKLNIFLLPLILFSILGFVLIFLTIKQNIQNRRILTGRILLLMTFFVPLLISMSY